MGYDGYNLQIYKKDRPTDGRHRDSNPGSQCQVLLPFIAFVLTTPQAGGMSQAFSCAKSHHGNLCTTFKMVSTMDI